MRTVMATPEVSAAIVVLSKDRQGEILGPGSTYDVRRSALRSEYAPIVEAAKAWNVIEDEGGAKKVVELGRLLQNGVKEGEAFFKSVKVQIDEIKRPILAAEKEDVGFLEEEKQRLAGLVNAWDRKVEAARLAAQRAAQAEADRIAAVEREEARKRAEDEQLEMALQMSLDGDMDGATALVEAPVEVQVVYSLPVVVQAQAAPKMAGKTGRMNWTASVEDWVPNQKDQPMTHPGWKNFRKLVEAVAAGKVPLQALLPNEGFIAAQGRALKQGFEIPGCKVKEDRSVSFRA